MEKKEYDHVGRGHYYIADAAARDIRAGRLENDIWSLETSLFQMEVFDEVMLSLIFLGRS